MATIDVLQGITHMIDETLKDGPYACKSLEKLSGGVANFVYRGTLTTPLVDGSKSIVIKHTEPFSASNSNFRITNTRCEYEQTILHALNSLKAVEYKEIAVQTPRLHHFSPETHTQIYQDLPSSLDLKTYVLAHAQELAQPKCERLGMALGLWLRKFHEWGRETEQKGLVQKMNGNREMRDLKYRLNYVTLVQTVANFPSILGDAKGVFEEISESVKEEGERGEGQLIHGDFWTGNVILPSSHLDDKTVVPVFVLDWELSQISSPAYDLGQMLAELYELYYFKNIRGALWIISSFISGYGKIGKELALKTVIHTGVHLICWGSRVQGWGTKEQVEGVVALGREWVVKGWERDEEFFSEGPLEGLFEAVGEEGFVVEM